MANRDDRPGGPRAPETCSEVRRPWEVGEAAASVEDPTDVGSRTTARP
ncbi:hypothetical protein [Phenylobacterium sp.]